MLVVETIELGRAGSLEGMKAIKGGVSTQGRRQGEGRGEQRRERN